jgi:hypothetical protein
MPEKGDNLSIDSINLQLEFEKFVSKQIATDLLNLVKLPRCAY